MKIIIETSEVTDKDLDRIYKLYQEQKESSGRLFTSSLDRNRLQFSEFAFEYRMPDTLFFMQPKDESSRVVFYTESTSKVLDMLGID